MSKGKLFIFAPFGTYTVHHQLDAISGLALKLRDFEVFVVLCDGIYSVCDILAWSGDQARIDCANCASSSKHFFSQFSITALQLRSYLTEQDFSDADIWAEEQNNLDYYQAHFEGTPIGEWVVSSVCSYFRITSKQLHEPHVQKVHKEFLKNGLLTFRAIHRILEEQKPTHAMIFNARIAPYRVAFEICKNQGIPVVVHERGWAENTFVTFANKIAIETAPIYECAEAWRKVPLQKGEIERVQDYFANREKGIDINITPFVTYTTEHSSVRAKLRIPPEIPIVSLFTTGEYELEFCDDFKAPISQLEFIKILIDIFKDRKECLVIRHHPYIAGDAISPPDRHYLSQAFLLAQNAPDNIRTIMPGEKLSSYALFWNIAACIAPFSTTGVEALARGVKSFGFKISPFIYGLAGEFTNFSREGIERSVDELLTSQNNFNVEDLRKLFRFQSSFISRLCSTFSCFGIKDLYLADIKATSVEDLMPGKDLALDRVCNHILNGTELFETPGKERFNVDDKEESELLNTHLEKIKNQRAQVKQASDIHFNEHYSPSVRVVYSTQDTNAKRWLPSLRKGRHQNLRVLTLAECTPEHILTQLVHSNDPYCIVKIPQVTWFDEAFISRGVEELEIDSEKTFGGILTGNWFADKSDTITHGIFTKHYSGDTIEKIDSAFHQKRSWILAIASIVFRKEAACTLMQQLTLLPSEQERYLHTISFINQSYIKKTQEGLVLVCLS